MRAGGGLGDREGGHRGGRAAVDLGQPRDLAARKVARLRKGALEGRERTLASAREAHVHVRRALEQEPRHRYRVLLTRLANPHRRKPRKSWRRTVHRPVLA
jgi:hypothetical protein